MNHLPAPPHDPADKPQIGQDAHDTIDKPGRWDGPTYYGRSQLKPAPFNNWVVGGYIALAGLSGASALIGAVAEATQGLAARKLARRSRYLSLLAPTIGSALLVWDLHTPQRFYNMMRVAKRTSPMSIGTWILLAFTGPAMLAAGAQLVADARPRLRWPWRLARAAQIPAAIAGAGLSTYTASLLAATSTPLWAAAPQSMAVRFGASAIASGAAALSLGERSPRTRRALDALSVAALAAELAATVQSHRTYKAKGVEEALQGSWGQMEQLGATGLGAVLPLCLKLAGTGRTASAFAMLGGSLLLRVSVMELGDASAARPEVSFRFSQPENLPKEGRPSFLKKEAKNFCLHACIEAVPRLASTGARRPCPGLDAGEQKQTFFGPFFQKRTACLA